MKPAEKEMINKIIEAIKGFGDEIQNDNRISIYDKLEQVDVLLDTIKFLDNYNENVKILNEYHKKEKWKESK